MYQTDMYESMLAETVTFVGIMGTASMPILRGP